MKNNNNNTNKLDQNLSVVVANKLVTITNADKSTVTIPLSTVKKIPILLESLLKRIEELRIGRAITRPIRLFDLSEGKPRAALQGLGGVYVLWCKPIGLFYVGSALRFFTKEGRLNDYYMPGRVAASLANKKNSKVSKDLAKAINEHGITSFTLIVVEEGLSGVINKRIITEWEQFWMSLNPTLNRSLLVNSNNGAPMPEEDRRKMSTVIYQYEMDNDGMAIKSTETIRYGLKDISRTGIIAKDGSVKKVHYETIHKYFNNGGVYGKFVFLARPLDNSTHVNLLSEYKPI